MLVFADLAQLVEQHIRNVKVASSIPAIGTISLWKFPQRGKIARAPSWIGGLFCFLDSHHIEYFNYL
jgi:hypothetical protein